MTNEANMPLEGGVTPHVEEESVLNLGDITNVDVAAEMHEELVNSLPGGKYPEIEKKLDELRETIYNTFPQAAQQPAAEKKFAPGQGPRINLEAFQAANHKWNVTMSKDERDAAIAAGIKPPVPTDFRETGS